MLDQREGSFHRALRQLHCNCSPCIAVRTCQCCRRTAVPCFAGLCMGFGANMGCCHPGRLSYEPCQTRCSGAAWTQHVCRICGPHSCPGLVGAGAAGVPAGSDAAWWVMWHCSTQPCGTLAQCALCTSFFWVQHCVQLWSKQPLLGTTTCTQPVKALAAEVTLPAGVLQVRDV